MVRRVQEREEDVADLMRPGMFASVWWALLALVACGGTLGLVGFVAWVVFSWLRQVFGV